MSQRTQGNTHYCFRQFEAKQTHMKHAHKKRKSIVYKKSGTKTMPDVQENIDVAVMVSKLSNSCKMINRRGK